MNNQLYPLSASEFGPRFLWGVAIAAAQNEGAWNEDERGASIWDMFARRKGKIKGGAHPYTATDFYHRFKDDLLLVKALGFNTFRFSLAWPRIIPDGSGKINQRGLAFLEKETKGKGAKGLKGKKRSKGKGLRD